LRKKDEFIYNIKNIKNMNGGVKQKRSADRIKRNGIGLNRR
jgi:hypothetical protein